MKVVLGHTRTIRLHVSNSISLPFPRSWHSSPGVNNTNRITAITSGAQSAILLPPVPSLSLVINFSFFFFLAS
uniref:Uncharacterized protein n=1 Tax=Rhizophora mucronata TaxID=61149 RepID=A0A2P2QBN2_RHIMU